MLLLLVVVAAVGEHENDNNKCSGRIVIYFPMDCISTYTHSDRNLDHAKPRHVKPRPYVGGNLIMI